MAYGPPIHSKYTVVAMKDEATPGTPVVPSVLTDAFLAYDTKLNFPGDISAPNYFRPYAAHLHSVFGSRFVTGSFKVPLVGCGMLSTDVRLPPFDVALRIAKLGRTDTGSPVTARTWTPDTLTWRSATLYAWFPGADGVNAKLVKVNNVQAHVKLVLDTSTEEIGFWEVDFVGLYNTPEKTTVPEPVYFEDTPPALAGSVCTIDGESFDLRKLVLDVPVSLKTRKAWNTTTGYGYMLGILGTPTYEVAVDARYEDSGGAPDYEWFKAREDQSSLALNVEIATGGTGVAWTITAANLRIFDLDLTDDDDVLSCDLSGELLDSSGDDAISFMLD